MKGRLIILPALVAAMLVGCQAGSAPQELEQLRARVSTLEAENAHLLGQVSANWPPQISSSWPFPARWRPVTTGWSSAISVS